MNIRLRPEPPSAAKLLEELKGHRFNVTTTRTRHTTGALGPWTEELRFLEDESATLDIIMTVTGCSDVEVMFEADLRPPGQYPFSRLTVVLNDEGVPIRAFFG